MRTKWQDRHGDAANVELSVGPDGPEIQVNDNHNFVDLAMKFRLSKELNGLIGFIIQYLSRSERFGSYAHVGLTAG